MNKRSHYKNAHPDTVIIFANVDGVGIDGERFDARADPQQVLDDLVWEIPVVIRLPDATLRMGTRIVVTTAGAAAGIGA